MWRYEPIDTIVQYRMCIQAPYSHCMGSGHLILCFILSRKSDTLYEVYGAHLYYSCHLRRGIQAGRMASVFPPSRKSHRDFCLCKKQRFFFPLFQVELENKVEIKSVEFIWNIIGENLCIISINLTHCVISNTGLQEYWHCPWPPIAS